MVMSNLGKREALKFLCQYLHKNDDGSEVISFGDSTNDNEMLEYSKLSFAPSNGRISTKQAAKEVSIYNNNEEYVARILEKIYLRPPSTSSIIDNIINNSTGTFVTEPSCRCGSWPAGYLYHCFQHQNTPSFSFNLLDSFEFITIYSTFLIQ